MKLNKVLQGMQNSSDCLGFKEHKVLTTNVCYGYPIEGEEITGTMKKLKEFGMDCYRNGWLQAISTIQDANVSEEVIEDDK